MKRRRPFIQILAVGTAAILLFCTTLACIWYRSEMLYSQRRAVLKEVSRWLMRGESSILLPPAVIRSDTGMARFSWRLQLVTDCLPTRSRLPSGANWEDAIGTEVAERGEKWMARHGSSGPLMMGVVGSGTAFDPSIRVLPTNVPPHTILFVEVIRPEVHWTEPVDIGVDEFLNSPTGKVPEYVGSDIGDGFHVAFADATVWYLSKDTPSSLVASFADLSQASKLSRDEVLVKYRRRRD